MNKETIFICFICIAAMGITLYLVFKKSNDVEKNIQKRCDEDDDDGDDDNDDDDNSDSMYVIV